MQPADVRGELAQWNGKYAAAQDTITALNDQLRKEFVTLVKKGEQAKMSFKEIAELAGISRNTAYSYVRKAEKEQETK